jgi:hydrogenase nickel incorporation protein HypA/HybF
MHEVSIAINLLEIASEQCRKNGFSRVEAINLKIGRASGILPDALIFAFNAVRGDTICGDAVLAIEEIPVSGHCNDCDAGFAVEEEYVLCCPVCKGGSFAVTAGRELDIVDMEVS